MKLSINVKKNILVLVVSFGVIQVQNLYAQPTDYSNIPLILPNPDYVSPNDTDLIYREVVYKYGRKYRGWGNGLGQAIGSFVSIQSVLHGWNANLVSAEIAFWDDYATTGTVNEDLKNEVAYWLHKRELWSHVYSEIMYGAKQAGGTEMAEVFGFIFGNGRAEAFTIPSELSRISPPTIDGPPADHINSTEYKNYFRVLSQLSYLKYCSCSPARSNDPVDKIAYRLMYPVTPAGAVKGKIDEIEKWANGDQQKIADLEQYLSDGISAYGKSIRRWEVVDGYMAGQDPIKEQSENRFYGFMQLPRVFMHVEIDGPPGIEGVVEIKNVRGFPVDSILIHPFTHDQVKSCVVENWSDITNFIFKLNSEAALRILENPTMTTQQFYKDIGYVSIIGCVSPHGLNDQRVPGLLAKYGMVKM